MATLYRTNGTIEDVSPKNGKKFSLEELQKFVGGYIERVDMFNGNSMYVNEEGRFRELPININASTELSRTRDIYDFIVGNAVVLQNEEEE